MGTDCYVETPDGGVRKATIDEAFARELESSRIVAQSTAQPPGIRVSTVFLRMDHQYGEGEPLLYETMVFGGQFDQCCWRYHTRAEAQAGHNRIVAAIEKGANPHEAD